ncbi:hypothetical protein U9R90_14405 [Streptomyces sp. E11-3]|uniref:hypothetical protein n=1 Tax=Streptomyces sp. E11-3 TaxID=3110112 RepID=UPI00397FB0E7
MRPIPVRPLARLLAAVLTAVAVLVMVCASAVAAGAGPSMDQPTRATSAAPMDVAAQDGEPLCEECVEQGHSNCDGPVGHAVRGASSHTPQPVAAAERGPYAATPRAPEACAIRLTDAAPRAPDLHLLQRLRV